VAFEGNLDSSRLMPTLMELPPIDEKESEVADERDDSGG
jgi:hypothetical protein